MHQKTFKSYANLYKNNLLEDVVPFWEKHSIDKEFGGYFTSLDRTGKVFDTDKFSWLQGRQTWLFSRLYNRIEKKENWVKNGKAVFMCHEDCMNVGKILSNYASKFILTFFIIFSSQHQPV